MHSRKDPSFFFTKITGACCRDSEGPEHKKKPETRVKKIHQTRAGYISWKFNSTIDIAAAVDIASQSLVGRFETEANCS
jgi:hypothetical protein